MLNAVLANVRVFEDKSNVLDKSSPDTTPSFIFALVTASSASFAVVTAESFMSAVLIYPSFIELVVIFVIEPMLFQL